MKMGHESASESRRQSIGVGVRNQDDHENHDRPGYSDRLPTPAGYHFACINSVVSQQQI